MTTRVARMAIAVMALHIVDDSFVQPARGTTAADHLVSGLVPLAVLAGIAWAFPRLPAGAPGRRRAAARPAGLRARRRGDLLLGPRGLSGDDFTGLLAIGAGLALCGVAAMTLWSSRRLDDSRWWRYPRAAAAHRGGAARPVPARRAARARLRLHAHRAGRDPGCAPRDGLRVRHAADARRPPPRGLVHPVAQRGGGDRLPRPRDGAEARPLPLAAGYGVLLYDRRGEGASDGDPHAFGWTFDEDIRAGVAFLRRRPDVRPGRIGGLGLSVGGEMMLQTAAGTRDLAAVVADGAGSRVASEEISDLHGLDKLFAVAALHGQGRRPRGVLQPRAAVRSDRVHPADRPAAVPAHPRREGRGRQQDAGIPAPRPAGPSRTGRSRRAGTPPASGRCRRSTRAGSPGSSTARCARRAKRSDQHVGAGHGSALGVLEVGAAVGVERVGLPPAPALAVHARRRACRPPRCCSSRPARRRGRGR